MTRAPLLLIAAAALASAPPASAQVTIKREAVALYADPACIVKIRETKVAQLGPLQEVSRAGGCVQLRDQAGKLFYVMETVLAARVAGPTCVPRPGAAPAAADMAGVAAGAGKQCP